MKTVHLSKKGQITIPKKLRDKFEGTREFVISEIGETIQLFPKKRKKKYNNIMDFKGSIKSNVDVNKAIDQAKFLKALNTVKELHEQSHSHRY